MCECKFAAARIHFLSDVFVAVALVVAKKLVRCTILAVCCNT